MADSKRPCGGGRLSSTTDRRQVLRQVATCMAVHVWGCVDMPALCARVCVSPWLSRASWSERTVAAALGVPAQFRLCPAQGEAPVLGSNQAGAGSHPSGLLSHGTQPALWCWGRGGRTPRDTMGAGPPARERPRPLNAGPSGQRAIKFAHVGHPRVCRESAAGQLSRPAALTCRLPSPRRTLPHARHPRPRPHAARAPPGDIPPRPPWVLPPGWVLRAVPPAPQCPRAPSSGAASQPRGSTHFRLLPGGRPSPTDRHWRVVLLGMPTLRPPWECGFSLAHLERPGVCVWALKKPPQHLPRVAGASRPTDRTPTARAPPPVALPPVCV